MSTFIQTFTEKKNPVKQSENIEIYSKMILRAKIERVIN